LTSLCDFLGVLEAGWGSITRGSKSCAREVAEERDPIKFEALLVELNKLLEEEHAPRKSRWLEDRSDSEQPE
jgi:hypothetical protein